MLHRNTLSQSTASKQYSKNALKAYKEQYIYEKDDSIIYPSISASEINSFLRLPYTISDSGTKKDKFNEITVKYISKIINSIDKQLNFSTDNESIYYRGIPMNIYSSLKSLPDKIMTNKAYTSCSKNITVAKDFAGKKGAILCFKIPKNIKVYSYADTDGEKDEEEEILIQRNTQFILHPNTEKIDDGYTIAFVTLTKYTSSYIINNEYTSDIRLQSIISKLTAFLKETNRKNHTSIKLWDTTGNNIKTILKDMKRQS